MTLAVGQNCRIADPGAVWDHGLTVKIVEFYRSPQCPLVPPWPVVRTADGSTFVINPERLVPTARPLATGTRQLQLFGEDHPNAGSTTRTVGRPARDTDPGDTGPGAAAPPGDDTADT